MHASAYRGLRGIPFEELEGAGMVGLVRAAEKWQELGSFADYASVLMRNEIKDYIRDYSPPPESAVPDVESPVPDFYIWQTWSDREFIYAISEHWERVISSPEELTIAFDQVRNAGAAIRAATIGFTRREREILNARYFSRPASSIETIARHHKISYARTVFLIDRMLNRIREILESREAATPIAVRG